MQLFTNNNFTVVRQIANHTDATTYYVRAVIRNAYSDAILDTLDLTDKGSQRFKKDWRVPADPSGEGFYISIVTSVYTDSGYTTKSSDYGDEETTYLVVDRAKVIGGGGFQGGGGGSLARRDIRDIVSEELEKIIPKITPKEPKEVKAPKPIEMPKMRFEEVLKAIKDLPKPEKCKETDLKPLMSAIADLKNDVDKKEVTPETDLEPVVQKWEENMKAIVHVLEKVGESLIKATRQTIINEINDIEWVGNTEIKTKGKKKPKKEVEEFDVEDEILDIKKLTA